jgi:16S rRNA (guanine527-N7)-methyltransferase
LSLRPDDDGDLATIKPADQTHPASHGAEGAIPGEACLLEAARTLGVAIEPPCLEKIRVYHECLAAWSRRINLVSRGDEGRIVEAHLVDSMRPLPYLPSRQGIRLVDIGSGAGFPGIVLKIFRPDLEVLLIDSSHKRRVFLAHVCRTLGLIGIRAEVMRAEEAGLLEGFRSGFEVAVARASGSLCELLTWASPLLAPGGMLLAYKTAEPAEEIEEATATALSLGFSRPSIVDERSAPWRRGTLVTAGKMPAA